MNYCIKCIVPVLCIVIVSLKLLLKQYVHILPQVENVVITLQFLAKGKKCIYLTTNVCTFYYSVKILSIKNKSRLKYNYCTI